MSLEQTVWIIYVTCFVMLGAKYIIMINAGWVFCFLTKQVRGT